MKQPLAIAIKIVAITALIQSLVMVVDHAHYGRMVSPTWNILLYNTKAGGDELYGIEPWTYYLKNLVLNFNYVVLGVFALPILLLKRRDTLLVLLSPMYIWLLVVAPRPHKEERFLFPIYPCICLGAAIVTVTLVDGLSQLIRKKRLGTSTSLMIQGILWAPAAILSFSRTWALSKYYTAPLYVYAQLQKQPYVVDSVICTCGEWYRFPSSFYLPTTVGSFGFLPSSFQGQIPQPFTPDGSGPDVSTKFNDQNKPEPGAFVSIDDCDYLVDLFTSTDCRENDSIWRPVAQESFLDADRTNTLHRILYIPFLHEQEDSSGGVEYVDYTLYQRII
jgi:alpha-1,2-mannosyltransferase